MHSLRHILAKLMVGVALTLFCVPAHSFDPLTLILLRFVRDQMISSVIEGAVDRASGASTARSSVGTPPASPLLPLGMDDFQLRRLIDEGFVHLSAVQREEVYESVRQILHDPKNAASAPAIVTDLALKASAVRQTHEVLSNLTQARKQRIAAEAGEEYQKMPINDREGLATVLRARLLPMPVDLTDMILAEFDRVRAQSENQPTVSWPSQ